jgi:hypothetical protein
MMIFWLGISCIFIHRYVRSEQQNAHVFRCESGHRLEAREDRSR